MSKNLAVLKKYKKNQGPNNLSQAEKDNLILEYAPIVKMIANKIASRLPPSIQLDDLVSAGVLGLMDALEKWDPNRETKLKTYAEFRIRGAILDELRAQDWVPRSIRDKAKIVERAIKRLEVDLNRIPTDEEIAAFLQMPLEEFHEVMLEIRPVSVLSIDEAILNDNEKKSLFNLLEATKINSPLFQLNFKAVKKIMAESIEELPEKMRFILGLYYYEDLNFREIAEIMQVTESRVSQLHAAAVLRLRARVSASLEVTDLEIT
jgi:RNA polymerase sigma factor for flagellar operon FliA